jgi:hypothetical protein
MAGCSSNAAAAMLAHSSFLNDFLTWTLSAFGRTVAEPGFSIQNRDASVSGIPAGVAPKPQIYGAGGRFSQIYKYLRANARSPSVACANALA